MKIFENIPWWAKLIIGLVTISTTIIGSLWGGFEILDLRMDKKVKEGEKRVVSLVSHLRDERDLKLKALDDKFIAEVGGLKSQLNSMDNKLNILIGRSRSSEVKPWHLEKTSTTTLNYPSLRGTQRPEIAPKQSIKQM